MKKFLLLVALFLIINCIHMKIKLIYCLYIKIYMPILNCHIKNLKPLRSLQISSNQLGYEVTRNVGGNGVVALLKNGNGKNIMFRADMDGLPVEEKKVLDMPVKRKLQT